MNKFHFVSVFDGMTIPTYNVARATWDLNNIEKIDIHDNTLHRLCNDEYRKVPFIKDVINKGIELVNSKTNYVILITNSDSCLLPSVESLLDKIDDSTTLVLSRRDIKYDFNGPLTQEEILQGSNYEGKDGFAFTKNFWLKNRDSFHDTVYGAEFWDYLFYLKLAMNSILIKDNSTLYHRAHNNWWSDIKYRVSASSQLHNIKIAKEFLYKNIEWVEYKELFKEWEDTIFKFV